MHSLVTLDKEIYNSRFNSLCSPREHEEMTDINQNDNMQIFSRVPLATLGETSREAPTDQNLISAAIFFFTCLRSFTAREK